VISALLVLLIYPPVLSFVGALEGKDVEIIRKTAGRVPVINPVIEGLLRYASVFIRE
jgi:hypothetical protein